MTVSDDFDRARELYTWDKIVLSLLGVWPLQATYLKFSFWMVYLMIHTSMVMVDLYEAFGDLDLMIQNLSESSLEIMVIFKLFVLRFSRTIEKLITQIIDGVKAELYEGSIEKEIYLGYNRMAKFLFKACFAAGFSTSFMYHMKPLENRLRSVMRNDSLPYVLPYRTRLFFDVNDAPTFWFVFIFQFPMIYVHAFHTAAIGVLFSLVFHVCGKLGVLALRIRNLNVNPNADEQNVNYIFRDIVEKHLQIIRMAKTIDDTFCMLLLEELVVTTLILGLAAYNTITKSDMDDVPYFLSSLCYMATMLILIYGYCVAGEYLIAESSNIYNAFYECQWYDLMSSYKKQILICMAASNKPLYLTGGRFYIFSMSGFTSVLQTSMAYVSMLRTIV